MNELDLPEAKPLSITGICVVGVINATQMINLIMSPMSKHAGAIYPLYFTFAVIASVACLIGLWLLKRSAALAYVMILVCNQLVLLSMGYWEISAAVISAIIIVLLIQNREILT
jgi:hypothetical protein